ncbi:flagellar assembly protein FliH [Alteromonadaceae bacterium Bs31]|nr:flagellar assembly protein FliH [Alteromonadaceae bacterium Bs31]
MTDVSKQANRLSQEGLGEVSSWKLPSIGDKKKVVKSAQRERLEKKQQSAREKVENVSAHKKPKPLTADELKAIADQAQQEGYADGFKEGMDKGLKQGEASGRESGEKKAYTEVKSFLDDEKSRFSQIADRLMEPMQQQEQLLEKTVVELAIQIAAHLLQTEIESSPEKLVRVVNSAISALPVGAKNISVFVNEEDAKLIDSVLPEQHRNWRLIDDNSLASGGCRVETAESFIDYSVESRIAEYLSAAQEHNLEPLEDAQTPSNAAKQ